jgi:hypothetical protein
VKRKVIKRRPWNILSVLRLSIRNELSSGLPRFSLRWPGCMRFLDVFLAWCRYEDEGMSNRCVTAGGLANLMGMVEIWRSSTFTACQGKLVDFDLIQGCSTCRKDSKGRIETVPCTSRRRAGGVIPVHVGTSEPR